MITLELTRAQAQALEWIADFAYRQRYAAQCATCAVYWSDTFR